MAENRTLEQELIEAVDEAETWVPPPMPLPNFANISLEVPKKTSKRRRAWISEQVEKMMGGYRRDDYNNAGHFAAGTIQMLEQFPDVVIQNLTSWKSGLQTQAAFAPNPAEMRAFCERSLRSYTKIALNNARFERAAKTAKEAGSAPIFTGPKVDLAARNDTNDYWLNPARRSDHPPDPHISASKRWKPRSLQELAAEVGKTLTDEEIAALPNIPDNNWKKLKW